MSLNDHEEDIVISEFQQCLDDIKQQVLSSGYCFFEHPKLEKIAKKARDEYRFVFSQLKPHPQSERFDYLSLKSEKFWKKYAIGSENGTGAPYAQFLTTTYFSDWENTSLNSLFRILFRMRNMLVGLPREFGSTPNVDHYWNASRVHTYPAGGGFMLGHKDTYFLKQVQRARTNLEDMLARSAFNVTHVTCPLSTRGIDFQVGGFWIIDKINGRKEYLEKPLDLIGKLLIFDGNCIHGVDTVDPDRVVDLTSSTGRSTCLSNLYGFS